MNKMQGTTKYFLLFLLGIVANNVVEGQCPNKCLCDSNGFVNCSHQNFTEFPLDIPLATKSLDMSINWLTKVQPGVLGHLRNLQSLDLSSNPLSESSFANDSFSGPTAFTELRLNFISFKNIPRHLPASLTFLQMIQCEIKNMTKEDFKQFQNLQMLDLSYNNLSRLAVDAFANLSSLQDLELMFNTIGSDGLPDGIFKPVINLKSLGLKFNPLRHIPRRLPDSLEHLDLVGTGIRKVPSKIFSNLANLKILSLWANSITIIEDRAFVGLVELQILEIFQNNISSPVTNFTFIGLDTINVLETSENYIPSVAPGALQWFKRPSQIWLGDNNITTLDSSMKATLTLPSMQSAFLIFNPWTCDCHLKWLKQFVRRN